MKSQSSARERVFATPELLEAILIQLSPCQLLLAQRISRRFLEAINTSPQLQHLLFLRAAPIQSSGRSASSLLNSLPSVSTTSTQSHTEWTLNPVLRDQFAPWFVLPGNVHAMPGYEHLEMLDGLNEDSAKEAFLHKDASWRRMLLVQPPPKTLSIVRYAHAMGRDSASERTISFEDSQSGGVTMGLIYDITEAFLRYHTVSHFGLSILNSEASAPQITLYLMYTIQCCRRPPREPKLRSNGADEAEYDLGLELRDGVGLSERLGMDWKSDLTVEKGGLDHVDFERWKRERAPISSLLSDVR